MKIEEAIKEIIKLAGDNPNREDLAETPRRFIKVFGEIFDGYQQNPQDVLKLFSSEYKGMTVFKNIPFYSMCEHHLLPIIGIIDIGIVPNQKTKKVVGFSKIVRLVNIFAHRLQNQEKMTLEIADAFEKALNPAGLVIVIRARHLCMEMRGLKVNGHFTITSERRGCFKREKDWQEFITKINCFSNTFAI